MSGLNVLPVRLIQGVHKPEDLVLQRGTHVFAARFSVSGRWRWYIVDGLLPVRRSTIHPGRMYPIYAETKAASTVLLPLTLWLPMNFEP